MPPLYRSLFVFVFVLQTLISINVEARKMPRPFNNSVSALIVFGDSTVDPGNNNFISTAFRSNFPPYGSEFPGHIATGRFTNGRLVTDFIASYVGVKDNLPAYLDPELSIEDLMTGVSFASSGSGFDPMTTKILGVIPMQKQLENFKEYKKKLENGMGKKSAERLIKKAIFIISAGVNDIAISYYLTPFRRNTYDISSYLDFLLQILQEAIEFLRKEGAQMIAIVGHPPIGCVPIVITVTTGDAYGKRPCNETLTKVAFDYNQELQKVVTRMDDPNARLIYIDIYDSMVDMIKNPSSYGFEKVNIGCCGSGLLELTIFCNSLSSICDDPSKYMFFDSVHATDATHKHVFHAIRPILDNIIENFPE